MIRRSDIACAAVFFLWIACWSLAIPYNGAPDERTHLFLVEYLYRFHAMPVPGRDPAAPFVGLLSGDSFSRDTFWYFGLPYLHALGATGFAMLFAPLLPAGTGYLAARAFDWSLGALVLLCLLSIARRQGLRGPWPYAAAGVVALIPQVAFVFAYFNADAFALACTAAVLALFLRFAERPMLRTAWPFGVASGLLLCSKIYHFPALVFIAGLLIVRTWVTRGALARPVLTAIVAALIVAVPVIGLTYAQFGEVTGLKGQQAFVALHRNEPGALYGTCFVLCRDGLMHGYWLRWWSDKFFRSFFMTTGWMNVQLPGIFYRLLFAPAALLLFVASIVLAVRAIGRMRAGERAAAFDLVIPVLFWGMLIGTTLFNLIGSQQLLPQPQGRYLFVVLPFTVLLVARLVAGRPESGKPARAALLVPALAMLMLVANVASLAVTARYAGGFPAVGPARH